MIKIKAPTVTKLPKGAKWVSARRVTVTQPSVTKARAKQKAYRDRQKMGGLTWEQFLAETVGADG